MSQVYSITFNGFGDATATASPTAMPLSRDATQAVMTARSALSVLDSMPTLFIQDSDKQALLADRATLEEVVRNGGMTDVGTVLSRTNAAAQHVQSVYNVATKRRMLYLGIGAGVIGIGGYLYFRKR